MTTVAAATVNSAGGFMPKVSPGLSLTAGLGPMPDPTQIGKPATSLEALKAKIFTKSAPAVVP
jgi:hypothetical protein